MMLWGKTTKKVSYCTFYRCTKRRRMRGHKIT